MTGGDVCLDDARQPACETRDRGLARRTAGAPRRSSLYLATIGLLLLLPQIVGSRLSRGPRHRRASTSCSASGLNIVVGFAGLLDLGYVAFFAIGAYTTALLTSPASPVFTPGAAVLGRAAVRHHRRGASSACSSARRSSGCAATTSPSSPSASARSRARSSSRRGPSRSPAARQGILSIPPSRCRFDARPAVDLLPDPVLLHPRRRRRPRAWRRRASAAPGTRCARTSRWPRRPASTPTNYKLLAFGLGAAFGCLSGAFFAAQDRRRLPRQLQHPGQHQRPGAHHPRRHGQHRRRRASGAFVLVGLPELLREFGEYRLLIYGVVLVAMMLLRPEGLLPSRDAARELHERGRRRGDVRRGSRRGDRPDRW